MKKTITTITICIILIATMIGAPMSAFATTAVKDLSITAPSSYSLTAGMSGIINVSFAGQGIDSINIQFSGSGLTAGFSGSNWQPYPKTCTASINVSATTSCTGGTITFNLKNNSLGIIMSQTIRIDVISNASKLLARAKSEVGNNGTKYQSWMNNSGPWCHTFVSWCANQEGILGTVVPKTASCREGINWYNNCGRLKKPGYTPKSGDLVYICNDGGASGLAKADSTGVKCVDHVAIISEIDAVKGVAKTIGGNESGYVRNNNSYPLSGITNASGGKIVAFGVN